MRQRSPSHRLCAGKVQILNRLRLVAAARKMMRQLSDVIVKRGRIDRFNGMTCISCSCLRRSSRTEL